MKYMGQACRGSRLPSLTSFPWVTLAERDECDSSGFLECCGLAQLSLSMRRASHGTQFIDRFLRHLVPVFVGLF